MESGKKFWTRIHIDFSGTLQGKTFLDYVEPFSNTLCFTPNMLQQIKFCTSYIPPLKISRFICHPSTLILHSTTTNFTLPWTWQTLVYCHLVCPPPLMLSPIPLFWQTPMHAARPSLSIPSEAFIELLRQSWMFPFLCHYHALYMCCAVLSRSVMCNSLWPHAL